jgi:hypothetical protein
MDMSTEDAFKIILTVGNHVPPQFGNAAAELMDAHAGRMR